MTNRLTQVRREAEAARACCCGQTGFDSDGNERFMECPRHDDPETGFAAERAVWERALGEALEALDGVMRYYGVRPDDLQGVLYTVPALTRAARVLRGEPGAAP